MDAMSVYDEVSVKLNAPLTNAERLGMRFGRPRIPDRPDGETLAGPWVRYVVALGAEHEAAAAMTVEQLIDLASRLGG